MPSLPRLPAPAKVGPFEVGDAIGVGGMGEVFRGHDHRLDRPVALKRLRPTTSDPTQARDRFRREARALARVRHPSVVEVYDWIEGEDEDWLVMELLDGQSLRSEIETGAVDLRRAVEIGRDIASGLAAVHVHGIVHRDLKPDNVMVLRDQVLRDQATSSETSTDQRSASRIKLLDFGLAKRVESMDGLTLTDTISKAGQILGTVRYMSPEQASGGHVDRRSDIFSLGALLYELLTGVSPFEGRNAVETLTRICTLVEISAHRVEPEIPEPISKLVGQMLKKPPELRPQEAGQVAELLTTLSAGLAAGQTTRDFQAALSAVESVTEGFAPTPRPMNDDTWSSMVSPAMTGSHVRTLLLNDLVDSTRLVEKLGDERAAAVFENHDRLARDLLQRTGGREIDKSDGFLMLFERPIDAVRYALGYHDALRELSEQEGLTITSRVGIHVGEVVLRANAPDDVARGAKPLEVEGLAKATAARFMSLAGPGRTLISRSAFELGKRAAVGAQGLPPDLQWLEHGRYRMQGVEEPVEVFEVGVVRDVPPAPPKDTKKVKRVVEVSGRLSGWRLRASLAATVLIVALAVLGGRQVWLMREPPDPLYIAVPPVQFDAGPEIAADLKLHASAIQAGILRALLSLKGAAAVEPGARDVDVDQPLVLMKALGTDEVLTTKVECTGRDCQVLLRRIRGLDGSIAWSGRFSLGRQNFLNLSLAVSNQIRGAFPELKPRPGIADLVASSEDYEAFLLLVRDHWTQERANVDDFIEALEKLRIGSPRFLEVYEAEIGMLAQRFDDHRQSTDLERGLELLEEGRKIAPKDPRILKAAIKLYQVAGKIDEAYSELEILESWEPGDADFLALKARILKRDGQLDEAIALMENVVARRPSWTYFATLAILSREKGDLRAQRQYLDQMLLQAPENYYCQSVVAEFELMSGSIDQAAELYEKVVERAPQSVDLNNLGVVYFLQGRYGKASAIYRRVLEQSPGSPHALLNLADAELLAESREARPLYEQVLEQVEQDPDPEALLSVKAQALAQLDRPEEALEAIQAGLKLSPDDPLMAYEASVVYVLVGEETSALLHARRALGAGVDRVWFNLAWFQPIVDRL